MENKKFNLIMLSAFHEQGGNTLLRFLDGHPNLFCYPFESQISTPLSSNILAGTNHWVPQRYAYPEFTSEQTPEQVYHSLWDEELKTLLRTPFKSKFKDCGLVMDEKERIASFVEICKSLGSKNIRAHYIEAFFRSTFKTWKNYSRTGKEIYYVGYSPPINLDADKFFADFPDGHMVHIIRNPFSGYADTLKRPFPFSIAKYCQIWNVVQLHAKTYESKYENFHIIYAEELFENPKLVMRDLCRNLDITESEKILYPSFNGQPMKEIFPWGTIKSANTFENIKTAEQLSEKQFDFIHTECQFMLNAMKYWQLPGIDEIYNSFIDDQRNLLFQT